MVPLNRLLFKMLHSLTGLYLAAFLFFHLYSNAYARLGKEAYNQMASSMISRPYLHVLEIVLILLPLTFHGFYGLYLIYQGRDNLIRQHYLFNGLYSCQRWTGIALFVFLGFHVILFRLGRPAEATTFDDLSVWFQNTWMFAFTLAGCLVTTFHITGGLWNAGINWGILMGPASQKKALAILAGLGLIVFLLAWDIIRAFVMVE